MKRASWLIIFSLISAGIISQNYLLGPQPFDTDIIIHGATAPVTVWFAPNSNTPIDFIATGGCTNSCIGYSGSWNSYWGNFVRMPQVNCSGYDTVLLKFNVSHSYFTNQPNDWCRFYVWADNGYKHNVVSVKINGADVTYDSGVNGKGFKFSQARSCDTVVVMFNISAISNKTNILFYIETNCNYNNSNVFMVKFDNIGIIGGSSEQPSMPSVQAKSVTFTNVTDSSFFVSWLRGSGSNCAAFICQADTGTAQPVDGNTYSASGAYPFGDEIAGSGWYCIYNGSSNSTSVTGLSPNSTYRIMVCEYNGAPAAEKYNNTQELLNPNDTTTQALNYISFINKAGFRLINNAEEYCIVSGGLIDEVEIISVSGKVAYMERDINKSWFCIRKELFEKGITILKVNGEDGGFRIKVVNN